MRFGVSYFVNARPLSHRLEQHEGVELVYATPARLSYMLARNELDAALTSSSEYFRGDYLKLESYAMSSARPGAEAVLYSRVPLEMLRSVALDAASMSTNYLLRLLLDSRLPGQAIRYEVRPGDPLRSLAEVDACLLIGDEALRPLNLGLFRYDLTEMWVKRTGLPMVYSLWLYRPEAAGRVAAVLDGSCRAGHENLAEIAVEQASHTGLDSLALLEYLRECLDYGWSEAHEESLQLFGRMLAEAQLIGRSHFHA